MRLSRNAHQSLEDRRFERVVTLLQNRIELMVMAACALHGEAQDATADGGDGGDPAFNAGGTACYAVKAFRVKAV